MGSEKVQVLYIAGDMRSGSTLLGRLLGQQPGHVHVGEVSLLWQRLACGDQICGCGEPFDRCDFWQAVVEGAFGTITPSEAAAMAGVKHKYERLRRLPRQWMALETNVPELRSYGQATEALYAAIRDVSGARVIVDGSKSVPYSYTLAHLGGLDLRLVHLVRDSRAVAYSQQRKKLDPAVLGGRAYMGRLGPFQSALRWSGINALLYWRPPTRSFLRLRYEALINQMPLSLDKIGVLLDESLSPVPLSPSEEITIDTQHTVCGNPDRFQPRIQIKADTEWQEKMTPTAKMLVTAMTYPLLCTFGYAGVPPIKAGRSAEAPLLPESKAA